MKPKELGMHAVLGQIKIYPESRHLGISFNKQAMNLFTPESQKQCLLDLQDMLGQMHKALEEGKEIFDDELEDSRVNGELE